MAETDPENPNRVMDISQDGDVILIVGEEKSRLRVQSHCLSTASKVFNAMFQPTWKEGQHLYHAQKESPTEVSLAEDNAHAMWITCCIVHFRNDLVPERLTAEEIYHIAIVVDKYDLKLALRYASKEWMKQPEVSTAKRDMGLLLAAAFLFGDPDVFASHTLSLVLHHTGSYVDFSEDELTGHILPPKIFHMLEERRTSFRTELYQLLVEGEKDKCECGWGKRRGEEYAALLRIYEPKQIFRIPISELTTKMEKVPNEDMVGFRCVSRSSSRRSYYHPTPSYEDTLLGRLELMKNTASISIDCI